MVDWLLVFTKELIQFGSSILRRLDWNECSRLPRALRWWPRSFISKPNNFLKDTQVNVRWHVHSASGEDQYHERERWGFDRTKEIKKWGHVCSLDHKNGGAVGMAWHALRQMGTDSQMYRVTLIYLNVSTYTVKQFEGTYRAFLLVSFFSRNEFMLASWNHLRHPFPTSSDSNCVPWG